MPPSNPKLHPALWLQCAVMTALDRNAPKLRPQAVVAMASPAASLAISQHLAVTANLAVMAHAMADVMVVARALRRAVHDWVMQLSVPNALLWNQPKMR